MGKTLTVYRASAGSGKTFRLAVEYIKLVVQNPQSYRNILAVTFTNKATEEMKMRILSQLYGIWHQLPDSQSYMERVCSELDADPEWVSRQAGTALSNLLHNYNYFRVMTIDTFFQSVLRNLARELDLTPNLRIGLNDSQVEEMAVDQLIENLQSSDRMLQWILKYIMDNISDDRSWNVIGQIKHFGKTIFRDYYKEESRQLNQVLAEPGFFERYTTKLRDMRRQAKERMHDIAQSFFTTLENEGLTVDDLSNKKRGIASFFYKLQNGIFDESIENQTVANHLGNPEKWYAKSHARREHIHALADGPLGDILRLAVEERPLQWRVFQSADLTLRHLSQLRLLSSIEQKVRQLNEESNRFLLSDTQQLLRALISDSDSPFIFEKIGTQLEHVMIDEFQDTSTVQWQNFRVLLQEAMSHEGSKNLIVGDVKQSIYRWRSGDWRLLNNIDSQFPGDLTPAEPLDTNRRSARRIIEFNNAFFTEAVRQEYALLDDMPEAEQLTRAYQEVAQKVPKGRPDEGSVSISLLPAENYQQQTLDSLVSIVGKLIEQEVSQSDIAILVRTNNLIPLIAKHFTEQMADSVKIVSDEAFRLDASLSVCIIIQALHLLTHPDDPLARAFLEKSAPEGIPAAYTDHSRELLTLPLYELVERLFSIFSLDTFDNQSAYVCAFYDQLAEYTTDNTPGIDDFVREWEENLCSKTIQSDVQDGIRLISIHKSKGLEFNHVIIPFCDWQLEKPNGNILWCHPAEPPFSELPLVPVDYSQKGMTGTIYEADYHHEHLQNVVDNLNLLYVAFTRAARSLYVIGKRDSRNSRSAIIQTVLPTLEGTFTGLSDEQQPITFEYGNTLNAREVSSARQSDNVFLQQPTPLPVSVSSFRSKAEFRQSNKSQEFISGSDEQSSSASYIQLGSILHRVFSTIRTTADIDHSLQQLEDDGILYDDQLTVERITTMLRKRLEHPKVAEWFSNRWTLFNECTILSVEDGHVIERRPDRVMTDGKRWIVVDFKFGQPREEYHEQVRQYMQLIRQMGHHDVTGYLWFVYSNQITEVI
jgi:ATP-dependent exoDNAse (exonuclease V) beta subunit